LPIELPKRKERLEILKDSIGVGLIGCGGIGKYLASRLLQVPGARLVAVCDENASLAGKVASEFSARAAKSNRELIDSPDVQGVIVGTPQFAHKEVVLAVARGKKHIFCEKPMALTVADCDEMLRAADKAGVKFMVGQVLRLIPLYATAKQLIASEKMGQPTGIVVTRMAEGFSEAFNVGWRRKGDLTGGVLFEVSVHELDFMRHICGEVDSVFAQSHKVLKQELDYEDLWHVQLKFQNGAIGLLRAGLSALITEHHFTIYCPQGTITTNTPNHVLTYKQPSSEKVEISQEKIGASEEGFVWELRSWIEAIREDKPMIVTARDGRQAVAIAEAAMDSARTGAPVRVKPL